jgi:hypothetical protein
VKTLMRGAAFVLFDTVARPGLIFICLTDGTISNAKLLI